MTTDRQRATGSAMMVSIALLLAACANTPAPTSTPTLSPPAQGHLELLALPDGRTVYLPVQPPAESAMMALLEGTLVERAGCLRVISDDYPEGFLVLWPHGSTLHQADAGLEVHDAQGRAVARVGAPVRMAGGAMESPTAQANWDERIPGLPLAACPGPYWVAAPLETLAQQAVPDIWVDPFTSNGRLLALFIAQSRPASAEGVISGTLEVDAGGCMRVAGYTVLWPPRVYLREEPLRLVGPDEETLAEVGGAVHIPGAEKSPADYRYFADKVRCPGPYWGAADLAGLGSP